MSSFSFDATSVKTETAIALAEGVYDNCQVVAGEMRTTNAGDGAYLWLNIEVELPDGTRRHVFDRLHLQNKNPKAVEIAERRLSQLCHAIGKLVINDIDDLLLTPFRAKIKVRPDEGYGEQNEVTRYLPAQAAAPKPKPAPAPESADKPWQGARTV